MARPTRGARHTPARQTQRRNGNGTATAQRQPDNVTCVWRRIIITFNTTTTFTTTSNRNSMVAGKSGLQANQTRSKHLACQGVAGKSGLQANQRRPGVAGKILQPPIPSKNPSGGAGLAHQGPGRPTRVREGAPDGKRGPDLHYTNICLKRDPSRSRYKNIWFSQDPDIKSCVSRSRFSRSGF